MGKYLMIGLTFFLIAGTSLAAEPASLYQAQVPVASQSPNDWQTGVNQALAQVLVKISGSTTILNKAAVKNAIMQAESYVDSYSYVSPTPGNNNLMLQVQFYGKNINKLLQDAGISATPKQYPNTLACFVIETSQGKTLINSGDNLAATVKGSADAHNLPITLPLMDLSDMQTINANNVWQLNNASLAAAAQRYGTSAILTGKIYPDANQQWQGVWSIIFNQKTYRGQAAGNNINQVIANIFDNISTAITTNAKIVNDKSRPLQITLHIVNVNNLNDYADIGKFLRQMPQVSTVDVVNLNATDLVLSVNVNGTADNFITALNATGQMTQVPNLDNNNTILTYRWGYTENPNNNSNNNNNSSSNNNNNNIQNTNKTTAQLPINSGS